MIDDTINSMSTEEQTKNPKELFDVKNIEGKTELTSEQVMIISRLKIMSERLEKKHNITALRNLINHFLKLQLSKDRSSRKEFVSAMQSQESVQNQSLLDKLSIPTQEKK